MRFAANSALLSLLLISVSAQAAPSPEVEKRVIGSYDPQISFSAKDKWWSFNLCPLQTVVLQAKDPVTGNPGTVSVKEYANKAPGGAPGRTIILVPPTGGENVIDDAWANLFCKSGFRVLLVQHWDQDNFSDVDPGMHDLGALRAIAAVRHTVEYAARTDGSIGILGTSVGAITSALSLEIDPRIVSGTLIVGGGGMAEIIANSNEKTLSALREERMSRYGYATIAQYQEALTKSVTIDPLDFAGYTGKKPVLAMVAGSDTTVPTKNQLLLVDALGAEKIENATKDHLGMVEYTASNLSGEVLKFFQRTLN